MEEYSDGYVIMPGLKAYGDGVIDAHTGVLNAAVSMISRKIRSSMLHRYSHRKLLSDIITKANAEGYPVRIHCTGDGSMRMALNAFEASDKSKRQTWISEMV